MKMRLPFPETGAWGNTATWEFSLTRELTPEQTRLTTAVACVAISDFARQRTVLVRSQRGWGMVAETRELGETPEEVARRGLPEEGGFIVTDADTIALFGIKKVVNNPRVAQQHAYPPVGYMPYYYARADTPKWLMPPTGEEILEARSRSLDEVIHFGETGVLKPDEAAIIELGYWAAAEDYRHGR